MTDQRFVTMVAVVSTVLTGGSLITSYFQYKAADLQAQAAMTALMPQIQVRVLLEKVNSDKYTDQLIQIEADGGPVFNFSANRQTWLEIRRAGKIVHEQPLTGYFFVDHPTGRIKGELLVSKGYRNNEKFIAFARHVEQTVGNGVEVLRPRTILQLNYTDAMKQRITEYFLIDGGSTRRMQANEGGVLWEKWQAATKPMRTFELDDASKAEQLAEFVSIVRKAAQ